MRNSAGDLALCETGWRRKRQEAQTRKRVVKAIQTFPEEQNFLAIKRPIKKLLILKGFNRTTHFFLIVLKKKKQKVSFWPLGETLSLIFVMGAQMVVKKQQQQQNLTVLYSQLAVVMPL